MRLIIIDSMSYYKNVPISEDIKYILLTEDRKDLSLYEDNVLVVLVSNVNKKESLLIGNFSSIYKEFDDIMVFSEDFKIINNIKKFVKRNSKKGTKLSFINEEYTVEGSKTFDSILYFDLENISDKKKLRKFETYLSKRKIYNIEKIFISTHDKSLFDKHKQQLLCYSKKIKYVNVDNIPDAADMAIINELSIDISKSDKKFILFSNDNGLIEEFIKVCKKGKVSFKFYTTVRTYPTTLRDSEYIKITTVI